MSIDIDLLLEEKVFKYSPKAMESVFGRNEDYHFIVIGAGGTGGYLIPNLGRMVGIKNKEGSDHTVTIVDADQVEEHNLLRQNFSPNDIGKNKAEVMATRYGRAFGETFYYLSEYIETAEQVVSIIKQEKKTTIVIDCVDNNKTRFILKEGIRQYHESTNFSENNTIMISSGNEEFGGQIVFSYEIGRYSDYYENEYSLKTQSPDLIDVFPDMDIGLLPDEESCAERAVSAPQNIATNMTAADIIFGYVNKLLNNIEVDTLVYFFDSRTMMRKSYSGRKTHVKELLRLVEGNEMLERFFPGEESWPSGTKGIEAPTYEEVLSSSNEVEDIIERASELEEGGSQEEESVFVEEINQDVSTVVPQETEWTEAPEVLTPLAEAEVEETSGMSAPVFPTSVLDENVTYESHFRLYSALEIEVESQESETNTLFFDGHAVIAGISSRIGYRIDVEQAKVIVHTTERVVHYLTPEGQDRFIETFVVDESEQNEPDNEEELMYNNELYTRDEFLSYVDNMLEIYQHQDASQRTVDATTNELNELVSMLSRNNIINTESIDGFYSLWQNAFNEIIDNLVDGLRSLPSQEDINDSNIDSNEEYHVYLSVVDLPEIAIQQYFVEGVSCSSMTFDDELIIENIPGGIIYYAEETLGEIKVVAQADINDYLTTAGEDILMIESEEEVSQAPTIYYDGTNYTRREMYDFLSNKVATLQYTNPEEDEWDIAQVIVQNFIDYLNELGLSYEFLALDFFDVFNEEHESIMDHLENLSPAETSEEEPTFYYNDVEYTISSFETTVNNAFSDWRDEFLAPGERHRASFVLSDLMEYLDGTDVIESTTLGDFYEEWENDPTPVLNYMEGIESSNTFYYNNDIYTKREFIEYINSLIESYNTVDRDSFGFMLTIDNLQELINTLNRYNILATQPIVDFIEYWENNYNELVNELFDTSPPINVNWREDIEEDEETAPVAQEPIQESLFSTIEGEDGEYTLPFDTAEMNGGVQETVHFSIQRTPDITITRNYPDAVYSLSGEVYQPESNSTDFKVNMVTYIENTPYQYYYKINIEDLTLTVYSNGPISENLTEDGLNHQLQVVEPSEIKTIYFEGQEYSKEEMTEFISNKINTVNSPHRRGFHNVEMANETLNTLVLHLSRLNNNIIITVENLKTTWSISPEYILTKLEEVLPITSSENTERASNPIAVIIRANIEDFEERVEALYYTGRWIVRGPIDNYIIKELNDGRVMVTAATSRALHPDHTRFRVLFDESDLSFLETPIN